ncbi:MAG: hypothetical protein AB1603_03205 [Chloroflexota bacterium]
MVETPVGMRCRECARLQKLPIFQVSWRYYLRAVGAGLGLAVAFGVLWALVRVFFPFSGYFSFVIALAVGYGIGELIGLAVGRRRGPGLALTGGVSVAACYLVGLLVAPDLIFSVSFGFNLWDILFGAAGVLVAVNLLR